MAEDFEFGSAAALRRRFPDCFETIHACRRIIPFSHVRTIYDIGAARGSWTKTFHALFPEIRHAVLFEPAQGCRSELEQVRLDGVQVERCYRAVGERRGFETLHGTGAAASVLRPNELQRQFFAHHTGGGSEVVEVTTVDDEARSLELPPPDLIKIDVQGWELPVLSGATQALEHCSWLVVELSVVPLYDGQDTAPRVLGWLESRGWHLASIGYRWTSPKGRLLQFDAIMTREAIV